jgi:hypothetical protein
MRKPIKYWHQVVILILVPFGVLVSFWRIGRLRFGILLTLIPIGIISVATVAMRYQTTIEKENMFMLFTVIIYASLLGILGVKLHYLKKYTVEYNLGCEIDKDD